MNGPLLAPLCFLILGDLHYDTPDLRPGEPENAHNAAYQTMWRERPSVWARVRLEAD